jgi:hypothetical protein
MRITLHGDPCGPQILGDDGSPRHHHRMSVALFCPGCGEIWARITRGPTWYASARWCGRSPGCENDYAVPGSFFAVLEGGHDVDTFLAFPAFAAHEFEVQLRWAERRPFGAQPQSQGELL